MGGAISLFRYVRGGATLLGFTSNLYFFWKFDVYSGAFNGDLGVFRIFMGRWWLFCVNC